MKIIAAITIFILAVTTSYPAFANTHQQARERQQHNTNAAAACITALSPEIFRKVNAYLWKAYPDATFNVWKATAYGFVRHASTKSSQWDFLITWDGRLCAGSSISNEHFNEVQVLIEKVDKL